MQKAFTTAADILLLCSRGELSHTQVTQLTEAVARYSDWTALLELAEKHGVTPLLYKHLKKYAVSSVPRAVMTRLHSSFVTTSKQNLFTAAELSRLVRVFHDRGIEALSFKGPCLALDAYGDLSSRMFFDVDLIIAPEQVVAAQILMKEMSYTPEPNPAIDEHFMHSSLFRQLTHEQTFALYGKKDHARLHLVDIHWSVAPTHTLAISFETLREHAKKVFVAGQEVYTLKPEMLLVLLSVHANKHQWQQIKWVVDIGQLIVSTPELDWNLVYTIAKKYGVIGKVGLGLWLCKEFLQFDAVPEAVLQQFRNKKDVASLATVSYTSWFAPERRNNLRTYWHYELATFDSFSRRAAFMLWELFHPGVPDYERFPLPLQFSKLLFFAHPVLLIGDFIAAWFARTISMSKCRLGFCESIPEAAK